MSDNRHFDRLVESGQPIVKIDVDLAEAAVREQLQQFLDARLNQVDAGRFQGLQKPGGQTNGDDIPVPGGLANPSLEFQKIRF